MRTERASKWHNIVLRNTSNIVWNMRPCKYNVLVGRQGRWPHNHTHEHAPGWPIRLEWRRTTCRNEPHALTTAHLSCGLEWYGTSSSPLPTTPPNFSGVKAPIFSGVTDASLAALAARGGVVAAVVEAALAALASDDVEALANDDAEGRCSVSYVSGHIAVLCAKGTTGKRKRDRKFLTSEGGTIKWKEAAVASSISMQFRWSFGTPPASAHRLLL